LQKYYITYNA